jgi:Icc protein
MHAHVSRREALKWTGALAGSVAIGVGTLASAEVMPERRRTLRLAHLTDMHICDRLAAAEGVTAALQHVQSLADKPELILTGGDTIMESLAADADSTKSQWELWQKTIRDACALPIESCLGNHDVWGWNKTSSKTTGDEPLWGKRWACEVFGIPKPYRSFDRAGWHFIVLDSMIPHEKTVYEARLDDEQFAWLQEDLAATTPETPVLVLSHIPILSASVLAAWSGRNPDRDLMVPHNLMHTDMGRLKDLFWQHRNVKLCLSGHLHLRDRVDYNGVTYLCNGAVSGAWWKGDHHETKAGYAVINLYNDGTFDNDYIDYGWKARV